MIMGKRLLVYVRTNLEKLYLVGFAVYLISVTINTTTFYPYYPHRVATLIQLLTALYMLALVILGVGLTTWQTVGEIGLLCLVTIVTLMSSANYLVTTVLLVMAAREIQFRKIIKVYLWVVGSILLVAFIAAMLGIIDNITFVTDDGLRQSFGVVYTTDFAAHIFYLCCAYLDLIAKRFRLLNLLPVLIGLWVIYYYTHTITNIIGMLVLLLTYVCYIYRRQLKQFRLIRLGLRGNFLALPLCAVIITWLTAIFNYQNNLLRILNDALSTRLALGYNGLLAYGVKLFGQSRIPINGWGGERSEVFTDGIGNLTYFYLDSSFINMLISYGLILTLVIIIGITVFLYLRTRQKDYLLPIMFVAISICSAFDQHFLEVTYNVFLLALFAKLPRYHTLIPSPFSKRVSTKKIS